MNKHKLLSRLVHLTLLNSAFEKLQSNPLCSPEPFFSARNRGKIVLDYLYIKIIIELTFVLTN